MADPPDSTPIPVISNVVVVGFHHQLGPIVEFAYPPFPGQKEKTNLDQVQTPKEWSFLPFLALPDGAHMSDEDFTYFHLPPVSESEDMTSTLFGISCNRQLAASELINRTADVTRSTVQKSVVVLARQPIFGPIKERLGVVTKAYFNQKNFEETEILTGFYHSLNSSIRGDISDMTFYMGTSVRELVHKFKLKTLVLLKLLLLERKIMFYGHPVERLCTYQYSLVSLIPDLLKRLEDAGSPELCTRETEVAKASSLKTSDRQSLMSYLGLPLNVFEQGCFFQPYLPLQQIDIVQDTSTKSFLVGVTNSIFFEHRGCDIDVLVNVADGTIKFYNQSLSSLTHLPSADRKWMDEIVTIVNMSWNDADPTRPVTMGYSGSDDFLRAKFEDYVVSLLASVKHTEYVSRRGAKSDGVLMSKQDSKSSLGDFNNNFVNAWKQTRNFELWNKMTDAEIFDIVEPRHPTAGQSSAIEDVQIRLSHGIQDLRLEENLQPARDAVGKIIATGTTKAKSAMDTFFKEIEAMREQEKQKKSSQGNGDSDDGDVVGANGTTSTWSMEDTQAKVSSTLSYWGSYLVQKKKEIMNRSPGMSSKSNLSMMSRRKSIELGLADHEDKADESQSQLKPFELNLGRNKSRSSNYDVHSSPKRKSLTFFGGNESKLNSPGNKLRSLRVFSSEERKTNSLLMPSSKETSLGDDDKASSLNHTRQSSM